MRAILHADEKWGIGKHNDLMFSLPADMKFFRETTKGKVVVMGLNTLLSFPNAKPLKNRTNIVLCPDDVAEDVITVHNLQELLAEVKKYPADDVFVIGGARRYWLPRASFAGNDTTQGVSVLLPYPHDLPVKIK